MVSASGKGEGDGSDRPLPEWMQPNQLSKTWYGRRKRSWAKATPKGGYDRYRGYDLIEEDERTREGVDMPASILVLGVVAFVLAFVPLIKYLGVLFAIAAVVLATREFARIDPAARIRLKGKDVRDQRFVRLGRFLAIVAVILVVTTTLWGMKTDRDERIKNSSGGTGLVLQQDLDVEFESFTVGQDAVGAQTRGLPVEVSNTADGTRSFEFRIEALDGEGRRIADQLLIAAAMEGGEQRTLIAFASVNSDTTEALKDARFRVASAKSF